MYSGARRPFGFPSTKQKSQWFPQRLIRGGSSVTPIGSPSGRSMSYSTASPVGRRAAKRKRSSAVRNSQSRKSSSGRPRSEEHTSELQSPCNLVCRLLLEKKKTNTTIYQAAYQKTWRSRQPNYVLC